MSDQPVFGACLCGSVRFRINLPTLFCGHCHCTMCQRNHGAAYVTWFGVPWTQTKVIEGEDLLTRYSSSPHGTRSFCSACGTSLFCESEHHPDHVDIPLANMEGEIDKAPEMHFFFDSHVGWVPLDDKLPRLGGETGVEPLGGEGGKEQEDPATDTSAR
jgi:hypothetical protein